MRTMRINRVYKSLNRPLTILGVERKLFFCCSSDGCCDVQHDGLVPGRHSGLRRSVHVGPNRYEDRSTDPPHSAQFVKVQISVLSCEVQAITVKRISMINLAKLFKDYNDTGCSERVHQPLWLRWRQVFLTKSGDLGVVIHVDGIDHECLDQNTLDNMTRRFEAAMRGFGEQYRIYQYLFKRNNERIPRPAV